MAYILNTHFDPFSLQEMMQLASIATEAHNNAEQQYATMKSNANVFQRQIDPNDVELKEMYDSYMSDLDKAASELSKKGLNRNTSQAVYDLAARYSSDIVPMDAAFKRKAQLSEELRQLQLKDPSYRAEFNPDDILVSDLIKNPNQGYGRSISLNNDITNKVYNIAKNLSTYVRRDPNTWKQILGDQYFEAIEKSGYSPEEVQSIIEGKNGQDILAKIAKNVIDSSNASDYVSQEELWNAAAQGMMAAVGKYNYNTLVNHGWANPNAPVKEVESNDAPLYSADNIYAIFGDMDPYEIQSKYHKKVHIDGNDSESFFFDLFKVDKNGNYKFDKSLVDNPDEKEYPKTGSHIADTAAENSDRKRYEINSKKYEYMKMLAESKGIDITEDGWEEKLFNITMEGINKGEYYDATIAPEYYVGFDKASLEEAQLVAKGAIASANNVIYRADYDRESHTYKSGKSEKFDPEKDKITGVYWDPYTKSITFSINNKTQRYIYPINNIDFRQQFNYGIDAINKIDEAIKVGKNVVRDTETGNVVIDENSELTEERKKELINIRAKYIRGINNAVYNLFKNASIKKYEVK